MKILEFPTYITPDNTVRLPPEVAAQIQQEAPVRVVLIFPEEVDDQDWVHLTTEQFMKGYAESDAIYDKLSTG